MRLKPWVIPCAIILAISLIVVICCFSFFHIGRNTKSQAAGNSYSAPVNNSKTVESNTSSNKISPEQSQIKNEASEASKNNKSTDTQPAKNQVSSEKPLQKGNTKKIVYLTIDDGPSITTGRMLDILKQYDVKATFFVVGNQIKGREDLLRRMRDEGHSIGVHSYTHDIKHVYSSSNVFINEMLETQNAVIRVTGIKPVILRFPGGSGGHLDKTLLGKIHDNKFKIYDWNISSGDGMYPHNTPVQIFQNAVDSGSLTNNAILLMHTKPNNQNSCEALPLIIECYKKYGYEFKTITDNTPEYYFRIRNNPTP